jgi:hypothetical protein
MRPLGGLGAKALLAAGEFEMLLGHLGLQRFDQTPQFIPVRRSLADPPIPSKRG